MGRRAYREIFGSFGVSTIARAGLLGLAVSAGAAHAYKTDFREPHWGVVAGAGTYFFPLNVNNIYDPVPALLPSGSAVTGSRGGYLLPVKIGAFVDQRDFGAEFFGIYMTNVPRPVWTVTGSQSGTGSSQFSSVGVGASGILQLWSSPRLRLGVAGRAEYIRQRLNLTFGGESLDLSSTSILYGAGVQPELWLGDFYSLAVFAGYLRGVKSTYSAAAAGTLFGVTHAAGELRSPATGDAVVSEHGGVLIEATLKLSFY